MMSRVGVLPALTRQTVTVAQVTTDERRLSSCLLADADRLGGERRRVRVVEHKLFAGDHLVQLDVARRQLDDELGGRLRQRRVLVRVAALAEPEPEELLVDVLRLGALRGSARSGNETRA